MSTIPQPCQSFADQLSQLKTQDQTLRAKLATLVGADAWVALSQLGQIRDQIHVTQGQLDTCIGNNSAALQANLVIMDVGGAENPPPSRVANLWQVTPTGTTLSDSANVSGNAFSFKGPLPAQFAVSVLTTGVPDVVGPDFLSVALAASDFAGKPAIRLEALLGPELTIDNSTISELINNAFKPVTQTQSIENQTIALSVLTMSAASSSTGIELQATGQLSITKGMLGGPANSALSASATLSLLPSGSPTSGNLFNVIVSDLTVNAPGFPAVLLNLLMTGARPYLSGLVANQVQDAIQKALPALVQQAFVLSALPAGVTLSLRRLSVGTTGITFQPALGAVGTVLSTFKPPQIPPPS